MSSRNRFLTPTDTLALRLRCTACYAMRAMRWRAAWAVQDALAAAAYSLAANGFVPDYLALVGGATLLRTDWPGADARLIAAARLASVAGGMASLAALALRADCKPVKPARAARAVAAIGAARAVAANGGGRRHAQVACRGG